MSLSDKARRATRLVALTAALGALAGCQVRPLYSEGASGAPAQKLASIQISDADTRVAQEVRNRLIFLVGGGAGDLLADVRIAAGDGNLDAVLQQQQ